MISSNFRGLALDGATRYGAFPETRLSQVRPTRGLAMSCPLICALLVFFHMSFSLSLSLSLLPFVACILYVNGDDLRRWPSIWPHWRNDLKVASASLRGESIDPAIVLRDPSSFMEIYDLDLLQNLKTRVTKYAYELEWIVHGRSW